MDNPDEITEQLLSAPPPPRQRRRSTVDATTPGARPLFRPPSGSLQEPLDADAEDHRNRITRRTSTSQSEHPLPREREAPPPTAATAATTAAGLSKRNSMSNLEQAERRASIKQIMCDGRLSQLEKRRSIQFLMDGRRSTIDCGQSNPYLQAKAEAEAKLRSSSFGNGDDANGGGEGGGNGGEGEDSVSVTASTMGESMAESLSRRGSLASSGVPRRATMDSVDVQMMDLSGLASGAVAARPFAGGLARAGGSGFGGSFGDTNNTSSNTNNSNDNTNTNGNDSPMIEVSNHSPEAAAAIAHASLQTHSDHLASKHPYNATTTAVPAIAASASDVYPFHSKAKHRNSTDISRRAIETAPPCTHYERNCHIVSPCCGATFGCRICHDDCPVLPPSLNQLNMMGHNSGGELQMDVGMDTGGFGEGGGRKFQRVLRTSSMPSNFASSIGPPEHHNVDRFAIKEVICRECFTKQSSKT